MIIFNRFGFIRFDDVETATQALKNHNYSEVDGRSIELRFAEERPPSDGGSGGGFRGGGRGGGRGRGRGKYNYSYVCV